MISDDTNPVARPNARCEGEGGASSEPPAALSAAELLWRHWSSGTTLDALPVPMRPPDRAAGHAAQARLPDVASRSVLGWKIAATSVAGQTHIGVSGPLPGRLLDGQVADDGARVAIGRNRMRVAEPEFVFRFGRTIAPRKRAYEVDEVLAAVDTLHPGLEVPDSRFADFANAGEPQLLADNACADRFVLGEPARCEWRGLDLRTHRVHAEVIRDGGVVLARDGDGSAVLGDPRSALVWLVNELSGLGVTLHAGHFVTTGTCMIPLAIRPGDRVVAEFGVLGRVTASFGD